jgi:predicted DsbA family dithiol-disulfide isomerase
VYNAAVWLTNVRDATGEEIEVDWQPFSLAQVNSDKGEEFKYWEQPGALDGSDPTLLAHQAGLAAKRQGKEAFESFFMVLLRARHEDRADLNDMGVIEEAVVKAGLDMARFREDLVDPELLKIIGESHTKAVEEYGAFGVPTFIFPSGNTAFLKMFIPPDEQAVEIYDTLMKAMSQFAHVGEMKRPQPPWPHGVI